MSQKRKAELTPKEVEQLKQGYEKMGNINLELAQMCFEADNQVLVRYEEKLTECE